MTIHSTNSWTESQQFTLDGAHLQIVYDSRSGLSERLIYPFGLYTSHGFWYCACYDYKREMHLSLRGDRLVSITRAEGLERPPHILLEAWLGTVERDDQQQLCLRAQVTRRGMKSIDLHMMFGQISEDEYGGGVIDTTIPASEIDFFATRFLLAGTDVVVELPPELGPAIREKAQAIAALYQAESEARPDG